jgi:hypothetical protein
MVLSGRRGARSGFVSRGRRLRGCTFGAVDVGVGVFAAIVAGDGLATGREPFTADAEVARGFGAPFMVRAESGRGLRMRKNVGGAD